MLIRLSGTIGARGRRKHQVESQTQTQMQTQFMRMSEKWHESKSLAIGQASVAVRFYVEHD